MTMPCQTQMARMMRFDRQTSILVWTAAQPRWMEPMQQFLCSHAGQSIIDLAVAQSLGASLSKHLVLQALPFNVEPQV